MSDNISPPPLREKDPTELMGCLLVLAGIAFLVAKFSGLI